MSERHCITWFKRDEAGQWQWMGFEKQLATDDEVNKWFGKLIDELGDDNGGPEVFVVDLEHLDEISGVSELPEVESNKEEPR